jgi:hypothetical protein
MHTFDRPHERTCFFRDSILLPFWRRDLPNQPDHAGALLVPEPEAPGVLDHSTYGDKRSRHGCGEVLDGYGTLYRVNRRRSLSYCRIRQQKRTPRTGKLIMPVVLLVRVIECAGTGTSNGADASAFASSGQGADRRSASCTNAHTLGRVYVTFVPNVLLIGAVVSRSRKVSRRRSKKKTH